MSPVSIEPASPLASVRIHSVRIRREVELQKSILDFQLVVNSRSALMTSLSEFASGHCTADAQLPINRYQTNSQTLDLTLHHNTSSKLQASHAETQS